MSSAQELSEGWREIKEQKQDLTTLFQDMEQQLLSLSRRPAELETKIAQNMLSQAKVGSRILTTGPLLTRPSWYFVGQYQIIQHRDWTEICSQFDVLRINIL